LGIICLKNIYSSYSYIESAKKVKEQCRHQSVEESEEFPGTWNYIKKATKIEIFINSKVGSDYEI
jgi:hypothetical protein